MDMEEHDLDDGPPHKRQRFESIPTVIDETVNEKETGIPKETILRGLDRPISPPLVRRRGATKAPLTQLHQQQQDEIAQAAQDKDPQNRHVVEKDGSAAAKIKFVSSPIQLTRIRDFAPAQNVDTVSLGDILGDPLIRECWNMNFLFDVDFVMKHFDADVRDQIKIKIVHGFWRRDDERRSRLYEQAEQYPNVELLHAYIPDPFGTHHSKMLILLRHDDTAQVVIHTANMISRDWGNMTQAVWRSPLLPLLKENVIQPDSQIWSLGTGSRFKVDLIRYLEAYGNRLRDLPKQLELYDFSAVRAAFIGSTPSRMKPVAMKASDQTSWGWPGLRNILSSIPISPPLPGAANAKSAPNIVIQISSIATLGPTPAWLSHFQSVLSSHSSSSSPSSSTHKPSPPTSSAHVNFFKKRDTTLIKPKMPDPVFHIIFPTADEIRTSLDGYDSGASIHTKTQSATQQKQLAYLQPLLRHWKPISGSISDPTSTDSTSQHQPHSRAKRGPAAPHIKTYIRFSDAAQTRIEWAMLTSANLSKQAWGEVRNKNDEVWVQSWEAGVMVWPALFGDDARMVPVFGRDGPGEGDVDLDGGGGEEGREVERKGGDGNGMGDGDKTTFVGFRMPYDLPLQPYKTDEVPWVASASYEELDWKGQYYSGFQPH